MTTPTNLDSTNWSGAVLTASGGSFSTVSAEWTVPTLSQVPIKGVTTSDIAEWVGIDGYQSNDVCQAGVIETVQTSTNGHTTTTISCSAFVEWYPAAAIILPASSLQVNPGDKIVVTVATGGAGATTATVTFDDTSPGGKTTQIQVNLTAPTGTHLVGNSAEVVVETPEWISGSGNHQTVTQPLLSDFGSAIQFNNASATLINPEGVSSLASLSSAQTISVWSDDVPGYYGYDQEAYGSIGSNSVTVTEDDYWPASSSGSTLFGYDYHF